MAHIKVFEGNDPREENYSIHTAILIRCQEAEEEEEEPSTPEPYTPGYSGESLSEREERIEKQETFAFMGDVIGSALAFLFKRM